MKRFVPVVVLVLFFVFPANLNAQQWYENIFFSLSGQYYLIPDLAGIADPDIAEHYKASDGVLSPLPGFRAQAGYEWKKWSFGIEAGYTHVKGDNPVVTGIDLVPLFLKAGYSFYPIPKYDLFNLTPMLGAGMVFAGVDHHLTVIDIVSENITRSSNTGLLLQAGLRTGWTIPALGRKAQIFAAFSVDCIFEEAGTIPLPQIEIGVIVRPFRKKKAEPLNLVQEEEPESLEEQTEQTEKKEEHKELVYIKQTFNIFFAQNISEPTPHEIAEIDEAARVYKEFTDASIVIRGYAAPLASRIGHVELSRRRAVYCAQYLKEYHGIADEAMIVEWLGTKNMPENVGVNDNPARRGVEIIIEGWRYP